MSTTLLIIEPLICGIEVSIWLVLFLLSFTGINWIGQLLPQLEKWIPIITVLAFAIWYVLGMVNNVFAKIIIRIARPERLGKIITDHWDKRKKTKLAEVAALTDHGYESLEYFRSHSRILRATFINSILIVISSILFVQSQCTTIGCLFEKNIISFDIGIFGFVFIFSTFVASGVIEYAYASQKLTIRNTLKKK